MKRPSFQFYPYDLRNNANLRRCSWAARGVWLELMCLFHDSDEYGVLRWSLDEIALAVGCQVELVRELVEKGVLKGSEKVGDKVSFSTTFAQRNSPPISVCLLQDQPAPLWYSSRMVRDEHVRNKKGEHGAKSQENPNVPRKKTPKNERKNTEEKDAENAIDKGTFSPSPTSSSSSSSSFNKSSNEDLSSAGAEDLDQSDDDEAEDDQAPPCPIRKIVDLYHKTLPELPRCALLTPKREKQIRARWRSDERFQSLEWWEKFFKHVRQSKFLMGENKRGWTADIEFLTGQSKFVAVLEGKYHGQEDAA